MRLPRPCSSLIHVLSINLCPQDTAEAIATQRPPPKRRKVDTSLVKSHSESRTSPPLQPLPEAPKPEHLNTLQHVMEQLSNLEPTSDMRKDLDQARLLRAWAEGLMGVQSGALLQLIGKQMNAWARHAVAASAHLATQEDHKEELQHLASSVLGIASLQKNRSIFKIKNQKRQIF